MSMVEQIYETLPLGVRQAAERRIPYGQSAVERELRDAVRYEGTAVAIAKWLLQRASGPYQDGAIMGEAFERGPQTETKTIVARCPCCGQVPR